MFSHLRFYLNVDDISYMTFWLNTCKCWYEHLKMPYTDRINSRRRKSFFGSSKDQEFRCRRKPASQEESPYSTACRKQPDEHEPPPSRARSLRGQLCAYLLDADLPAAQLITCGVTAVSTVTHSLEEPFGEGCMALPLLLLTLLPSKWASEWKGIHTNHKIKAKNVCLFFNNEKNGFVCRM